MDLRPDPNDLAALVNEERRPLDPEVLPTVQVFLLPNPVGLGHPAFVVAEQREVEIVLLPELDVAHRVVATHAEDDRALRRDPAEVVAEAARLLRATRRVVLRIEVQHDLLPSKRFERHDLPTGRPQAERRSRSAARRAGRSLPPRAA